MVFLTAALAYHELTTQIPHAVDMALPRGTEKPRIDYPPASFYWFSGAAWDRILHSTRSLAAPGGNTAAT